MTESWVDKREIVRGAVRGLLEQSPEYSSLPIERRTKLAHDLVALTETSLRLIAEETNAIRSEPPPISLAQSFDPAANNAVASAARDTIDGIAFPRFVTELVNGVFKGLIDANAQQIQAYVDMISGVTAASADSEAATGPDQARIWLVQQFPDHYELGTSADEWGEEQENGATEVRLREGREGPSTEDVMALLELDSADGIDVDSPEEGLLGKVRAHLSRKRQQVIASLLTLGINRLVIDHGKIKAGMDFSIDAHSAAEENKARRSEIKHQSSMGGSVSAGPWGVNASMTNSIGIVNTSQSHRREEMNQSANLNADVELHFHSDYLPLNQFAARDSVQRITAVSVNPDAPLRSSPDPRNSEDRTAARSVVNTPIQHDTLPEPPPVRRASDTASGSSPSQSEPESSSGSL